MRATCIGRDRVVEKGAESSGGKVAERELFFSSTGVPEESKEAGRGKGRKRGRRRQGELSTRPCEPRRHGEGKGEDELADHGVR